MTTALAFLINYPCTILSAALIEFFGAVVEC